MRPLSLALLFTTALSTAAAPPVWTNAFSGLAHPAGVVLSGGGPVVAYTSAPCGGKNDDKSFRNRMAVAKFDAAGKQVYDVEIPRPKEVIALLRGTSYGVIDGIAALPDGDLIVIAEFIEGWPYLLRLDSATGGVRFSKPIGDPKGHTVLSSIASVGDDVVIGGSMESQIYVARYSGNGEKRWEQSVNAGGAAVVQDVAAMGDGSVVAAAATGANVLLIRFDKSGTAGEPRRFEGEAPQLAVARDTIGVAYDIPESKRSLRFKALDASLAELTEVAFDFSTTAKRLITNAGSFTLLEALSDKIRATTFTSRGTRAGDADVLDAGFALELRAAATGDAVFLAYVDPFFNSNGNVCSRASVARIPSPTSSAKGIQ